MNKDSDEYSIEHRNELLIIYSENYTSSMEFTNSIKWTNRNKKEKKLWKKVEDILKGLYKYLKHITQSEVAKCKLF